MYCYSRSISLPATKFFVVVESTGMELNAIPPKAMVEYFPIAVISFQPS